MLCVCIFEWVGTERFEWHVNSKILKCCEWKEEKRKWKKAADIKRDSFCNKNGKNLFFFHYFPNSFRMNARVRKCFIWNEVILHFISVRNVSDCTTQVKVISLIRIALMPSPWNVRNSVDSLLLSVHFYFQLHFDLNFRSWISFHLFQVISNLRCSFFRFEVCSFYHFPNNFHTGNDHDNSFRNGNGKSNHFYFGNVVKKNDVVIPRHYHSTLFSFLRIAFIF